MTTGGGNRRLAASLFPISGLQTEKFAFRVLLVRERLPANGLRAMRLQQWADRLWRRMLRCPVYPTSRFDRPGFLIPLENSPEVGTAIDFKGVPDVQYHIDVTDQTLVLPAWSADRLERELICRMVERPFTDRLMARQDLLWRAEWTLFFRLAAENRDRSQDRVLAYRGVKFGVVLLEGRGPCLAADLRTRYVGKTSLSEYTTEQRGLELADHLDLEIPVKKRASFLRDNGPVKIPCRYAGETSLTVGEFRFGPDRKSVFDYYRQRYPGVSVGRNDVAVYVVDRVGEGEALPVPASRLFPVFTTEHGGIRECSVRPQMTPQERCGNLQTFLAFLDGARYGQSTLRIARTPMESPRTVYLPPCLEFGGGARLKPFPGGVVPDPSTEEFDREIVRWGSRKLPALYEHGPLHNEPLPPSCLLFPDVLDRPVRESFLHALRREVALQTAQQLTPAQQRSYKTGTRERAGGSLMRLLAETRASGSQNLGIVVLWDRFYEGVHAELKDRARPMFTQCVREETVRTIAQGSDPQFSRSVLQHLALAVLTEVGAKPWVLADPLHHDLHIGIDLLHGRIGYHYLYGLGGRLVIRRFGQATVHGRTREAIKRPILRAEIEETLAKIVAEGGAIQSIVVHRDGRWAESESQGLREALSTLHSRGTFPRDLRYAVLEVRKNHMPVRLFTLADGPGPARLINPLPGTHLPIDHQRLLLTMTGRPGAWDTRRGRTASTLLLELVEASGDFRIEELGEDAYRLTHLNWSAPGIEFALPVTVRWTDEGLRETLRPAVEEEPEEDTLGEEAAEESLPEESEDG